MIGLEVQTSAHFVFLSGSDDTMLFGCINSSYKAGGRGLGRCWSKITMLKLCRMNKSRGLMYSMITIVISTVLNTGN